MSEIPRITPAEVKRRMGAGEDFTFVDVRNAQAWAQSDVMIPEAVRIPVAELEANLSRIPKMRPVVAYCT